MSGHANGHAHAHGHAHTDPATARVVLALGPESEQMPDLGIPAARPGRDLADLVEAQARRPGGPDAAGEGAGVVVVVPMTFGRAPAMVADCSRTLRDVRGSTDRVRLAPGSVALAAPLGDATMLITRLRAVIRRHGAVCSALVVSRAIDPFADAELYRLTRLARQYGQPGLVEVAFHGGDEPDPDLPEGLERVRALGGRRPVVVSATLAPAPVTGLDLPGEGEYLFGPAVLRSVIDTRVREAVHRLDHGDDGIDAALDAEDGHGYAHSHVAADGTVYTHSH
ncbi:hypothetical protein NGF75_07980 [Dietzia kunjamensis]|uniref:hypothetical protein n=1 Tax=Dietzia kunjamensis TaxID=322509 RepID=UPI002DB6F7BA|nr:hypothetical protein [Dietzia kunjamensis]MEB8325927.1 hypothetical protein [Dietzia kunjamensis]